MVEESERYMHNGSFDDADWNEYSRNSKHLKLIKLEQFTKIIKAFAIFKVQEWYQVSNDYQMDDDAHKMWLFLEVRK